MDFDDNAIFVIVPCSSGKIALVSHNEKYMNMYYLNNIKCEGPGRGLNISVTFLDDYFVQFSISGFKGQDGKTYYVSCEPGNASYHRSLAVKKEQDHSTFFVIEPIGKATLTGTVALKDINGKFMSVTSTNGLTFDKTFVEENAIFEAHASGSKYTLIGSNSKYVNMYYVNDVKCEGPGGGLAVGLYNCPLRRVNLTISGYSGQDGKTYFLSNLPGNESYYGSLTVAKTESEHCCFQIEPITKINVTGVITLVADDNAKFTVKHDGSKLALIGNNRKYMNMYYVDDVKCEGPGGGLALEVGYNGDRTVFLTISGYEGQNRATYFLSSEPGNASYNSSLTVKRCAVDTCCFYIDISGTIALRDEHGAYLHVTNDKGLVFSHGAVDNNAKFTVKQNGNKVNLVGVGYGSYVNMYGIEYVQCKGPSSGLALGVNTLVNGLVRLTISGYQGQDGKTTYLSSHASKAKESLLVASDGSDASCCFVVKNC
ncbi:hypothetical protein WG66_012036 [Moniliophthora roreri]|nr:hypothetical protein WG66_012036 [Moniliophthora roreri]